MLNYEFPPIGGGAGMAHKALLGEYARAGDLHVDVLTSGRKPGLTTEHPAAGICITRVGIGKKDLHHWRRFEVLQWLRRAKAPYRRMLDENEYDLVHAFFGFPTGWLCYRTVGRIPYILSLRGSDVPGPNARLQLEYRLLGPVFRVIWRNAAAVVACSEGLRRRALAFMPGIDVSVIPNGVDHGRFHPAAGRGADQTLRLLTVGRLSNTKRIDRLIEAVAILRDQGRKVALKIVGGGPLETELRRLIANKRLDAVVHIVGRAEGGRMPAVYRDSDVFVSASIQEGMSNAMLEAMATGLPIVTSRCEGVEELIADNGVVLDDDSPQAIAAVVAELADHREKTEGLSAAAVARAARFRWSAVAEKYLELYRRIAEMNRTRRPR